MISVTAILGADETAIEHFRSLQLLLPGRKKKMVKGA